MKLNDKIYNVLKWIALVVLPAIGTLYTALAFTWGFPHGEEVTGTILAVETFIGALIGISTATYNKTKK
jgi:hypothetical protein